MATTPPISTAVASRIVMSKGWLGGSANAPCRNSGMVTIRGCRGSGVGHIRPRDGHPQPVLGDSLCLKTELFRQAPEHGRHLGAVFHFDDRFDRQRRRGPVWHEFGEVDR